MRTARDTIRTHLQRGAEAACGHKRSWFTELRLATHRRSVTCERCRALIKREARK